MNDVKKEPPEICSLKFTRAVFGVSSSPFLLNATIRHHLEQYLTAHPMLIQRLLESTYVDDIVTGAATEGEAFEIYTQAKGIFREGGFNLRKFLTNSRRLQQRIDNAEKLQTSGIKGAEGNHPSGSDETYVEAYPWRLTWYEIKGGTQGPWSAL